MATSDKLQDLIDIKQDIKEALENKGADLTGVDFGGYAGKIDEIQTGGASQGETWVIKKSIEPGTLPDTQINFISNGISFERIRYYSVGGRIYYGGTEVWLEGSWNNDAFRTVTFETPPTGSLLMWLEANAVKQTDTLPAVVELTQAQYNALSVYDNNTYYLIVEE